MKNLTISEFNDRILSLQRARKIFVESGLTNNITVAFAVYQEIFATRERTLILNTVLHGKRSPTAFDSFRRPTCPKCGYDMRFRLAGNRKQGLEVQLLCDNMQCDTVLSSNVSMDTWLLWMQDKNGGDPPEVLSTLQMSSKHAPIPGSKYQWLTDSCPQCGGLLYEMEKCCGAPEGLIECSKCDWQSLPSLFNKKEK